MEHVWSATSKAGKIYIGDPCYVMKDAVYHGVWGDQYNFDDGEFDHNGVKFAIGGTAYGDGYYSGSDGTSFPVDAGVIGAVPSELLDEEKVAGYNERTFPGIMVDAEEVILRYDDKGRFDFRTPDERVVKGSIVFINTMEDLDESARPIGGRIREANVPGLKITYVTVSPTKIYDTYKGAIVVNASINGLPSEFVFQAARSDNIWFTGIDCNSATIDGERVHISNGGGQTHYALQIYTDVLKAAPKTGQKSFQWTGREYSTTPIIQAFKKALQDLFKKGDLTPQFLKAIGHKDEETLAEAVSSFTSSFRSGLREARAPKVKWYLMERDNPQLGTYWVAKGPFTKADAPGKSKSVYGGVTYHAFDTEEEYNAKIAELKANGERVRDF